MATGEFTSVTSQNELVGAEVEVERRQLATYPEEEKAELAGAFVGKGVDRELAEQVAEQVSHDRDEALRLHAQEELGVDPAELPSPVVAAVSSFFAFTVGAVIPLLSYFAGASNLYLALGISAAALFVGGAVVSRLTAQPLWYGGVRQLTLGALAAGVTYAVGRGIGGSVT
jgi:VIT1/CCC1 family predicted Fe2+/Mn2+ transporter